MAAGVRLTGYGPGDPELRELWRQHNEPMSIKIGEDNKGNPVWVSYKSIPGADLLFSAIADLVMIGQYLPEAEVGKLAGQLRFTIMNSVTNRTTLAGFIDLAGLLDANSWTARGLGRGIGDRINDLVPITGGSGLRRQVENAIAPGMYEYNTTIDAIKGRISGGIFGAKTPVMDIFTGKQMIRGTEGWHNFLNPFRVVHKDSHPIASQLTDLQYELSRGVVETDQGISLTIPEQQFIRAAMYSDGKLAKSLTELLESKQFKNYYQQWLDDKGTYKQKSRQESAWYRLITQTVGFYREKAILELRKGNSDISIEYRKRLKEETNTSQAVNAVQKLATPI